MVRFLWGGLAQSVGGERYADDVGSDADDHERDAVFDEEGRSTGRSDERGEFGDVVGAASDHASSRCAHPSTTGDGGSVLEAVTAAEFTDQRDLDCESAQDHGQVVPITACPIDEVVERA